MAKSKTPSFVLSLRLKTNDRDVAILNKRFNIAAHLYNSLVNIAIKRIRTLESDREYIEINNRLKELLKTNRIANNNKDSKKEVKELYSQKTKLQRDIGLSEYDLINAMTPMRIRFSKNMDNKTAQAIGKRVWKSVDKYLNGKGEKIHFQRKDELYSVEGLWNSSGIRYSKDKQTLIWNKLNIPVIIRKNDSYATEALENKIKYCRIIRTQRKGKNAFYLQLILEGMPPKKYNNDTGEIKNSIGQGNVGIDIGTSTVAVVGEHNAMLCELASKVKDVERKRCIVLEKDGS